MTIAIIDSTNFALPSWETSTTTTSSTRTASRSGRKRVLASVIAMAFCLRTSEPEMPAIDPNEAGRRRDQATIDHWVRSL